MKEMQIKKKLYSESWVSSLHRMVGLQRLRASGFFLDWEGNRPGRLKSKKESGKSQIRPHSRKATLWLSIYSSHKGKI
jgi:hypothetical protein